MDRVSTRTVYIAIPKFRAYANEWVSAVQRLQSEEGLAIQRVDALMRSDPETALLRLDIRLQWPWQLSTLVVWAHSEGMQLIDPQSLGQTQRAYFFETFLPQFRAFVREFVTPVAALFALRRALHAVPKPELFPEGTERVPRENITKPADIEWRVPRIRVVDKTQRRRAGNGTRTAKGEITVSVITRSGTIG